MRILQHHNKGSALVVVMIFVAVFGALALGYLASVNASLQSAKIQAESTRALAAAESGLAFARAELPMLRLLTTPVNTPQSLQKIADELNTRLGATLFGGARATVNGDSVLLPTIILDFPEGPASFQVMLKATGGDTLTVRSVGARGEARKCVTAQFSAAEDNRLLTQFGVASRSRIVMKGNAIIDGANDPLEGSVLSTNQVSLEPIDITGHVNISGNAAISNPGGNVSLRGNSEIGGDIMIGVQEPPFPEIDVSLFEPYAVNRLDPNVHTYSSDVYLENIRIPANTNPTFTANTMICGTVYIESPNQVTFSGNLVLIGTIVAAPAVGGLEDNYIKFTGNSTTLPVSTLPASARFAGLRALDGSLLLAPGYHVEFSGSFATLHGSIVASKMGFTGDATGTIRGSILNYEDTDFEVSGSSHLTIDHSNLDDAPGGMRFPRRLVYVGGTYGEP